MSHSSKAELYFLRSSEQFIVDDMLYYAARLDDEGKTLEAYPQLSMYSQQFSFHQGDIGVYALLDSQVVGAAWVRLLKNGYGYIDEKTPELVLGVKPAYRRQGIGSLLMQQLMYEVSGLYEQMSLCVRDTNPAISLYERLGFVKVEGSDVTSNERTVFIMLKKFEGNEASSIKNEEKLPDKFSQYLQNSYF